MKIIKFGEITFREGQGPDIHDWVVEREDSDPAEATVEQLILGFAITWAQEKFRLALNSAVLDVIRNNAEKKQRESPAACNCVSAVGSDDPYHFRTACAYIS